MISLRDGWESILAPDDAPAARELCDRYRLSAADLRTRYRLSTDELRGGVESALGELENSQIGTIHSFAAHLLRLYPLEAGVDPRFTPDEEFVFDDFFTREWREWLDGELGGAGPRQERWKRVLRGMDLAGLGLFARALVNDLIPLDSLKDQARQGGAGERSRLLPRPARAAGAVRRAVPATVPRCGLRPIRRPPGPRPRLAEDPPARPGAAEAPVQGHPRG